SSAKIFPEGTVLMAIYAAPTVGRLGILTSPATFNQAAVGIVPKENVGSEFVYLSLLSERTNLNNLASGAAQQNLNVGIVKNYIILVPEQKILDRFNRIVKGVFNLLKKNSDESRRLAELRDTLLPKLMSGELKVNEIDNSL
ncbi:MAG: restriction endonuclease subunit S, partial [Prevotella sp.]|nr:restriction endonuclease subunit S [Prevotella sp.]